jgi:hypothetical protein
VKEEKTLEDQVTELAKIRGWLAHKFPAERNEDIRHCLLEAQHAIGFALLQLQRVELRTGGTYPWRDESLDM